MPPVKRQRVRCTVGRPQTYLEGKNAMRRTGFATAAVGTLVLGAAGLVVLSCSSSAHDESAVIGELAINAVSATPAEVGQTSRVTFVLENQSSERIVITGLRLPGGEPSKILGSLGTAHRASLGSLSVGPGETLRLDPELTWIEVGPLEQPFELGTTINARLALGSYNAPLPLHVSPPPERSPAPSTTP